MQRTEPYVREHDGAWYVGETSVPVYSVLAMWRQGFSPEEIQESFPALSLQEAYGAILSYLERRDELDAIFRAQDVHFARRKAEAETQDPGFYADVRARVAAYRKAKRPAPAAS